MPFSCSTGREVASRFFPTEEDDQPRRFVRRW
jgi:hypothetical protein